MGSVLPAEGIATYCATKHAVLGYTDTVRMENRGRGVHFSAIMPTLTNTEMIAGFGHAKGFKNAEPEDVARAVVGSDRQTETACVRSPFDRHRRVGPAFHAAARIGGDCTRLGTERIFTTDLRSRQAHSLCPAHGDIVNLCPRCFTQMSN